MRRLFSTLSSLSLALCSTGAAARNLPNYEVTQDLKPALQKAAGLRPVTGLQSRVAHSDEERGLPTFVWVNTGAPTPQRTRLARMSAEDAARLQVHHTPIPELVLADLPTGSHLVILTHDHAEDAALCDAALRRADLGFIGLIGSAVKWARFREQLKEVGHTETDLARITTPIGIPGIRGKSPAVIALSVAAQLQGVLETASPSSSPLSPAHQRTP